MWFVNSLAEKRKGQNMKLKKFIGLFFEERENWDDLNDATINAFIVVNFFVMLLVAAVCIMLPVIFVYANVQMEVAGYSKAMHLAMQLGAVGVAVDIFIIVAAAISLLRRK